MESGVTLPMLLGGTLPDCAVLHLGDVLNYFNADVALKGNQDKGAINECCT
jgi:hypothetical protein